VNTQKSIFYEKVGRVQISESLPVEADLIPSTRVDEDLIRAAHWACLASWYRVQMEMWTNVPFEELKNFSRYECASDHIGINCWQMAAEKKKRN